MVNNDLEKIKKYVTKHYGNEAPSLLRKMSLIKGLANSMGGHAYLKIDWHHEGYFFIKLVKDFDLGNVSLKSVVIWQSSESKCLGRVFDEFLNAFRCKNAHLPLPQPLWKVVSPKLQQCSGNILQCIC